MLAQAKSEVYRLDKGDVLGIYIEGLLGERGQPIPIRSPETGSATPALGYPVPVQEDGTIALPFAEPIEVRGLTVDEARERIRESVTEKQKLVPKETARVFVTLMKRRRYHVVVVRQDTSGVAFDQTGFLGAGKRGSGYPIDLEAGENDVLNALAKTGGLPGLDANNEIIIQRSLKTRDDRGIPEIDLIRIPLRIRRGETPSFRPEDIVLNDGDIVFIESRETEVYYTAGLMPAGEHVLPRDYDLDVVEAVLRIRGGLVNGGINQQSQFAFQLQAQGIGFPSPSLLTVLRKTSDGRQLRIRVDLARALRDPRERILVQPGDILVLQEKPAEAVARYFTNFFRLNFIFRILDERSANSAATITVP
jgi:protein involved in polysaccharide export with SLBB domain